MTLDPAMRIKKEEIIERSIHMIVQWICIKEQERASVLLSDFSKTLAGVQ